MTFAMAALGVALLASGGWLLAAGALQRRLHRRVGRYLAEIVPAERPAIDTARRGNALARLARAALLRTGELDEAVRLTRAAGFLGHGAVNRFAAIRLAAAVLVMALVVTLVAGHGLAVAAVGALWGASVGYFGPKLVLVRIGAVRRKRIAEEMPFLLDIFLLLLRSGASIEQCFRHIAQFGGEAIPATRRVVEALIEDLERGRDYREALDRWAERMAIEPATDVAAILQQSLAHGTELSEPLSAFARHMVERRLMDGRALAGRRVIHITVAMMLFLLPPLVTVIAAPGFSSVVRLLGGR